jgi:hypothetical protein
MSPQVKMAIPHMKRMPPTKQRKTIKSTISPPIILCLLTTITCLAPWLILSYPLARLLILMEQTIINGSISPEVWKVVCDGVDFSEDDEEPTPEQLQKIHRNVQANTILNSSVDKKEFNRVVAWKNLKMCGPLSE